MQIHSLRETISKIVFKKFLFTLETKIEKFTDTRHLDVIVMKQEQLELKYGNKFVLDDIKNNF